VTRSMQTSAPGHPESALQRNPTAVASATSAVHAPVPASSPMEDGRPHVSPLEAHLPDPSNFLLTRLRDIELMSTEAQSYHVALDARVSELESQMLMLTRERDDLMMEIRALRDEFKKVLLQREPRDDVPTGDPKGRRNLIRLGKRENKGRDDSDPSLHDSEEENFSDTESESSGDIAADRAQGPPVSGLNEIIPSRSAYRRLLSYRTYRLVNRNQRYDPSVTAKLASYAKRMKHSLEEKFDGSEPIAVLDFLRSFKESADHNQVGEGAAARLMPYFLKGSAKEEYRSYLKEVPASKPLYPYMVQYLLETYASDDELARAYHMAVTARQRENEDERAFALRLRQIAASAGNVFDEATLKSIFVDGLAEYVQDSLRVHVTPDMPFSKVQRVAHQLGKSLRRTSERSHSIGGSRKKEEHASVRTGRTSAFAVEDEGDDSSVSGQLTPTGGGDTMEAALLTEGTRYPYGYNRVRSIASHSPEGTVFSVPTRGWDSPSASVVSAPIGGSRIPRGVPRQNLCFMCYKPGHVISDCPQLPGEVREQAAHNRALYYKTSTTPQVDLKGVPNPGLGTTPTERKSYRAAVVASPPSEVAVIEEYPPNLPTATDPVERNIMVETNNADSCNADSKNPQGGM
jgi:hypothetical protein